MFHQLVRQTLGQLEHFPRLNRWRIEAFLDAFLLALSVRCGHVNNALQMLHLAADLQQVLAGPHVGLHGNLKFLVEVHVGCHVEDDVDLGMGVTKYFGTTNIGFDDVFSMGKATA